MLFIAQRRSVAAVHDAWSISGEPHGPRSQRLRLIALLAGAELGMRQLVHRHNAFFERPAVSRKRETEQPPPAFRVRVYTVTS